MNVDGVYIYSENRNGMWEVSQNTWLLDESNRVALCAHFFFDAVEDVAGNGVLERWYAER